MPPLVPLPVGAFEGLTPWGGGSRIPSLALVDVDRVRRAILWFWSLRSIEAFISHEGIRTWQEETQMPEQSVVWMYDTMAHVEGALRKLDEAGFPLAHVSIVSQNLQSEREVVGYITVEDVAKKGLITGAWAGGLLSMLAGAAFLWIPGFGPLMVAGRLASLLLGVLSGMEGAVIGAAYGGVLGTLAGWGVSQEHIFKYAEHVRAGKHLVIVRGKPEEVAHARSILHDAGATALQVHAEASA